MDTHTGKTPCEDGGRDQGGASISQGMPKVASQPPAVRGEAWDIFSLMALRRNQPCQYLDLRFPASRIVRPSVLLWKLPSLWFWVAATIAN